VELVQCHLALEEAVLQTLHTLSFLGAKEAERLEASKAIKAFPVCLVKL